MKTILVIGCCGTGKTWLMKQLINKNKIFTRGKFGKINYNFKDGIYILGNYDGSMFEGSDKLSMSVATDFEGFKQWLTGKANVIICEGDRFTNNRFIETFTPTIIKINGDGEEGRKIRKSSQSERQLKSITTRISRVDFDLETENSSQALDLIQKKLKEYEFE